MQISQHISKGYSCALTSLLDPYRLMVRACVITAWHMPVSNTKRNRSYGLGSVLERRFVKATQEITKFTKQAQQECAHTKIAVHLAALVHWVCNTAETQCMILPGCNPRQAQSACQYQQMAACCGGTSGSWVSPQSPLCSRNEAAIQCWGP